MVAVAATFVATSAGCAFAVIWVGSSPAVNEQPELKLLPIAFLAVFGLWLVHNLRRIKVYTLMAKTFPGPEKSVDCEVAWIEDLLRDITKAWPTDVLTILRHEHPFTVQLSIGGRTIATVELPYIVDIFFGVLGQHHPHLEEWPARGATIAKVRMWWSQSSWELETVRFPSASSEN